VTFLISSHILGELSKIATRYGVIRLGKLVDEFDAAELPSRASQYIRIITKDIARAAEVLKTELDAQDFQAVSDHEIRLSGFSDRPALVNTTLAKADVAVESISLEGTDPESYFVSLMGGELR
jgi:ABC-2 type transport system ATP-binding protein